MHRARVSCPLPVTSRLSKTKFLHFFNCVAHDGHSDERIRWERDGSSPGSIVFVPATSRDRRSESSRALLQRWRIGRSRSERKREGKDQARKRGKKEAPILRSLRPPYCFRSRRRNSTHVAELRREREREKKDVSQDDITRLLMILSATRCLRWFKDDD